jgi:hypothetical protein
MLITELTSKLILTVELTHTPHITISPLEVGLSVCRQSGYKRVRYLITHFKGPPLNWLLHSGRDTVVQ